MLKYHITQKYRIIFILTTKYKKFIDTLINILYVYPKGMEGVKIDHAGPSIIKHLQKKKKCGSFSPQYPRYTKSARVDAACDGFDKCVQESSAS
jgi:hypothetical protein